jgi:cytochrome d ubiquinol oxidase subunit I
MQNISMGSMLKRWMPLLGVLGLVILGLTLGSSAFAATPDPFGGDVKYREMFTEDSTFGFLNARVIVWILAQLHLLFAAFVLAIPMLVVGLEVWGHFGIKDPAEQKRWDSLAYEFARLMSTAFSITSILGALLTFCLIGLYPQVMTYMVDIFGPTMYLYATMFFGESFSLYLYYYGWGKISKGKHIALGILLNVFGVTLMLVANAWTTFMMAPAGIDANGAVVDRTAAFFNFLLHPINVHRLIANVCMAGSVAGAYAAYKWLSTTDPVKRAHYDWMGYVGNLVAVVALLVLPFAGYYLGYEIYMFNQQLGIYMMGGILSWLFVMQAVLIGGLFLGVNYYLWLGMDRIEGAERYSGWIKWLLAVITVCVLVWATPKSLQVYMTSAEITEIGGTNHPIFGLLGVMSAKNTAVNIMILTTFLSWILYQRGNKEATVPWAKKGKAVQAALFGLGAGIVIFIGVGGYLPELWLESTKRVAMSPYQVLTVLVVMVLVFAIDIKLFKGAKSVGRIRWGEVSARSQYTLIFLAVSFTWLMALMGFVRSSLRQHWHVYEVLEDTSLTAFTPAIGYATVVVSVCVLLFFGLVGMVVWIAELGSHDDDHGHDADSVAAK